MPRLLRLLLLNVNNVAGLHTINKFSNVNGVKRRAEPKHQGGEKHISHIHMESREGLITFGPYRLPGRAHTAAGRTDPIARGLGKAFSG